jgi:23S rRNA (uridine2552-2'-O)-methyltransferase
MTGNAKGGGKQPPSGAERRRRRARQVAARGEGVRVRTAKRRKPSSTRWLERQLNDPYVAEAKKRGYRSRAAFKLLQMDEKLGLLRSGGRVVDLGAAPGGWTQVAMEKVGPKGRVVGIDLLEMEPVEGATILRDDFLAEDAPSRLAEALGGQADLVVSDMAADTTGHAQTDHLRTMALAEAAYEFARGILAPGGAFVAKVLQGGTEKGLLDSLKRDFRTVKHVKPPASRKDSVEMYVVALDFRAEAEGRPAAD